MLDPELQELLDNGTLRRKPDPFDGGEEYAIDQLSHEETTANGKEFVWYTLTILLHPAADECKYDIIQNSRNYGEDTMRYTDDASEVAAWIKERLE
jgi:hypothetical protein